MLRLLIRTVLCGALLAPAVAAAPAQLLHEWSGDGPTRKMGYQVLAYPDVTHDGIPEILSLNDSQSWPCDCLAYVLDGANGLVLLALPLSQDLSTSDLTSITWSADFDGDLLPEIVVGDGRDSNDRGAAFIYSSATGGRLASLRSANWGDFFGTVVAGAGGDVDGDGWDDFLPGAPEPVGPSPQTGYVRLYSGRTGAALHTFAGYFDREGLGILVSPAGDVNQDGVPDLALGSIESVALDDPPARVRVFSGADYSLLFTYFARAGQGLSSLSTADIGDMDLDGFDEMILADTLPNDAGRIRIYSGSALISLGSPSPGTAGVRNTLTASGATPQAVVRFVAGGDASGLVFAATALGEVLIPIRSARQVGVRTADGSGIATLTRPVPAAFSGRTARSMAYEDGSGRASATVVHTFP